MKKPKKGPRCGRVCMPRATAVKLFDPHAWGGATIEEPGAGGSGASWSLPTTPQCVDLTSARDLLGTRFGVGRVYEAGLSDQAARLRRFLPVTARASGAESVDLAGLLRSVGWRAWCPRPAAPAWRWLWRSFELFATVFGAVPRVEEVGFFDLHYRVRTDHGAVALAPSEETLALFGDGSMAVYRTAEEYAGGKPLAGGRSEPGRAAPIFALSPGDGFAFFIVHELAHGLVERTAGGLERLEEFRLFAGWAADGRLYDAGSREVEVIGKATRTPERRRITAANWNAAWAEQPPTQYATAHAVEDFAESAAAYALCPKLLELRAPRRHAFFEQTFPRGSPAG